MRRALLIGSQTFGLEGVAYDLSLMDKTLRRRGFSTVICSGEQASRAGILAACRGLINATAAEDAVILYYAGHGGQVPNPEWQPGSAQARYLHFFVPTDMEQSQVGDFRGILNLEFSQILAQLTAVCRNVTVLLDCCHAARLNRSSRARARALPTPWPGSIAEHLTRLRTSGGHAAPFLEGNPDVVCLAAAGASQCSYEDPSGAAGGYFTEILAEALNQVGESPVSWEILGRWVREQVLVMEPRQRPELQGPTQRLVFACDPPPLETQAGRFTFFYDERHGSRPSMRGGRVHGVAVGNTYAVFNLDHRSPESQLRVATARVLEVFGGTSWLEISGNQPCDGAPLVPLHENYPKRLVAVAPEVPASLRLEIESSQLFGLAPSDTRAPLARIQVAGSDLVLSDGSGKMALMPTQDQHKIFEILGRLARTQTLRELVQDSQSDLHRAFEVSWGQVLDGCPHPLPFSATIHAGQRIYVSVTNRSSLILFVNLFDIGVSNRISLLNDAARSGYELSPEETWCFGYQRGVGLVGVSPSWPAELPIDGPRLESIIAIISDSPLDLSILEGRGSAHRGISLRTNLEHTVAARCLGTQRSSPCSAKSDVSYAVQQIDFELVPERL